MPDAPTLKESVIIEAETCNGFRCSNQHEIKIYPIYSLNACSWIYYEYFIGACSSRIFFLTL